MIIGRNPCCPVVNVSAFFAPMERVDQGFFIYVKCPTCEHEWDHAILGPEPFPPALDRIVEEICAKTIGLDANEALYSARQAAWRAYQYGKAKRCR